MLVAHKKKGIPTPALDSKPKLLPSLQWIWQQFSALTRERTYAHDTPLPLRLADIDLYWSRFIGFDYEGFYDQIVRIDEIYLKQLNIHREKKSDLKKAGQKKPVR